MPTLQNQSVLSHLELEPTWSAKVAKDINDPPSTVYATSLTNGIRQFQHTAPANGGWLSGLNDLPIPANWTSGKVIHSAKMMFDPSIADGGAHIVAEFDNRVADGKGNNFNFSNQFKIVANTLIWQVDPQTGHWTNVLPIATLAPLVWHSIAFENFVDFAGLKASFLSLTVDGVRYQAPAAFSNLTPMKDAAGHWWKRGANLQMQQCRETQGTSQMWAQQIGLIYVAAGA